MNDFKRRHKILKYLFLFYKNKYDSTASREFPPEDYRVPISTFKQEMGILDYNDEAVLDPLLRHGEIVESNDGQITYYHIPEVGRLAYLNNKYLKEQNLYRQEWPKRNWIWVAILSFIFGSIISPLTLKFIERKILPDTTQSKKVIQGETDTTKLK